MVDVLKPAQAKVNSASRARVMFVTLIVLVSFCGLLAVGMYLFLNRGAAKSSPSLDALLKQAQSAQAQSARMPPSVIDDIPSSIRTTSANSSDHRTRTSVHASQTSKSILSRVDEDPNATLNTAIKRAISTKGSAAPTIWNVVSLAGDACKGGPDPYDSTAPGHVDPLRSWAVQRLMNLCQGFDNGSYHLTPPVVDAAGSTMLDEGTAAGVRRAFEDIATSHRFLPLSQAGLVLFQTGNFPFAQVLPDAHTHYGLMDLSVAWNRAVRLVLCREQGPCGPRSLQVAMFCRKYGCPHGSDLVAAYRFAMSAHQFRATVAFARWLELQR